MRMLIEEPLCGLALFVLMVAECVAEPLLRLFGWRPAADEKLGDL